jgi:hypothetical protein
MGATSTGLTELVHDLDYARDHAVEGAKKVVGKGMSVAKKQAQATIRAASHRGYLPHYPRAIGYEVTAAGTIITARIGADPAKLQGGLGNIIEYGSRNSTPIPHIGPAVEAELPVITRYLEDLGEKLIAGQPGPDGPVVDPGG